MSLSKSLLPCFFSLFTTLSMAAEPLPPFPLSETVEHSLHHRCLNKPVHDARLIDDMEQPAKWSSHGIVEMSYTEERAKEGRRSLRFRTSMRDEEHLRRNQNEAGFFVGEQGGWTSVMRSFDGPQDWSAYNRLSFWVYVHPTSMPTYFLALALDCQGLPDEPTSPLPWHIVQDLQPGQWNHVVWEIPNLKRDKVGSMSIGMSLRGHDPEDEGIVTFDIDQIELQRVDAEKYEGWAVAPGRIAMNQVGYRPEDSKIALAGEGAGETFEIVENDSNSVVLQKPIQTRSGRLGEFRSLDFSELAKPGVYRIRSGSLESRPFRIGEDIWRLPTLKALNFFFCERCGCDVPGIHRVCHQDWQGSYKEERKRINGGWHDAGDLSQGTWRTAMAVYAMLELIERSRLDQNDRELYDRTLDEALWGLDWLLKTQFPDGHRMSWSTMRIYTDNKLGTSDDVLTPAQNVPWENFLSAAVEALAFNLLKTERPELAQRSLTAAKADWQAARSHNDWAQASMLEASWGALAAIQLFRSTGDEAFAADAVKFGRLLLQCQEQGFAPSVPLTGFFYSQSGRHSVVHDHHAAFEESPLLALAALCETYPDHGDWIQWYAAALIHSEYFLKRGSRIAAPYDLIPNSLWSKDEILRIDDPKQRENMLRQWEEGAHVGDNHVLRLFPIWRDRTFHGNTNAHLSGALALRVASQLRGDREGEQLAVKQLQWIFGGNPFCQSLMYGEGYDYPQLFAYCLKDVVGALPVGVDSMRNDEPYWPNSNYATFKEIWTAPTERFLWLMAHAPSVPMPAGAESNQNPVEWSLREIAADPASSTVTLELNFDGKGSHGIQYRVFNATLLDPVPTIDLGDQKTETVPFKIKVEDPSKPWVVVVALDHQPFLRKEAFGAFAPAFP